MVRASKRLVICLDNTGSEASLERRKIYVAVPDPILEDEDEAPPLWCGSAGCPPESSRSERIGFRNAPLLERFDRQ